MTQYAVRIPEVHMVTLIVEAESTDMAKLKAGAILEGSVDSEDLIPDPIYSHTLEMDEWTVQEE